jgi:hypothetical protein
MVFMATNLSTKIEIDAGYILTLYPKEVEAIVASRQSSQLSHRASELQAADMQQTALKLADYVAAIVPKISKAVKDDVTVFSVKVDGVSADKSGYISTENALRTIFRDAIGIELQKSEMYKRLMENSYPNNYGYGNTVADFTLSWKREKMSHLRLILGEQEPVTAARETVNMNAFRANGTYCDHAFLVEGKKFPVHKAVLAGGSDFFHGMFSSSMAESMAVTPTSFGDSSLTAVVFERLLTYIYTRDVDLLTSSVSELMQLAYVAKQTLQDELFDRIVTMLRTSITKESFYAIALFARQNDSQDLIKACKVYLARQKEIIDSIDFSEMNSAELISCCDVAAALECDPLQKTALTFITSKIDGEHFEEVCDAIRSSRIQEIQKPLKEAAFAFAVKNQQLLASADMQDAKHAYTALMTGLEKPKKSAAVEI